jgi:hypothetical protein
MSTLIGTPGGPGRTRAGDRILIVSFGARVTWGSTILTWHGGDGGDQR